MIFMLFQEEKFRMKVRVEGHRATNMSGVSSPFLKGETKTESRRGWAVAAVSTQPSVHREAEDRIAKRKLDNGSVESVGVIGQQVLAVP